MNRRRINPASTFPASKTIVWHSATNVLHAHWPVNNVLFVNSFWKQLQSAQLKHDTTLNTEWNTQRCLLSVQGWDLKRLQDRRRHVCTEVHSRRTHQPIFSSLFITLFCATKKYFSIPSLSYLHRLAMAFVERKNILYVGGLDDAVSEEILHAAFIPFGDLKSIHIHRDASTSMLNPI